MSDSKEKSWFVIVERDKVTPKLKIPGKFIINPLPPYGIGPYDTETDAKKEANSDSGQAYSFLTIDAKNEGYTANECYWTQDPPKNTIMFEPVSDTWEDEESG